MNHAFPSKDRRAPAPRALMLFSVLVILVAGAAQTAHADEEMERRIRGLGGALDAYVNAAMQSFDNPEWS